MNKLSLPLSRMKSSYDVVVVGSGYGGGVAASRLARAGRSVCLLERGKEKRPGEYPDSLIKAVPEVQADTPDGHVGSPTAMFDFRVNKDLNVLVGCGLGGTSLINANVSLEAEPRVFDDARWPRALRNDIGTVLADSYAHARQMLRPNPYPEDWPEVAKLRAHGQSAEAMAQTFYRPPINVTFHDGVNHVGVEQRKCTLCGDCVTGCNEGAKNTTLMNYLPDAVNWGAEIFTEARVRYVSRAGAKWIVHFDTADPGREKFGASSLSVTADIVVLAAGTLGSTEILLRSKANGLACSDRVGAQFSGNGDILGFGYDTKVEIHGIGSSRPEAPPVGPCITSIIDERQQPDLEKGLVIEEGSLPKLMGPYLTAPASIAGDVANPDPGLVALGKRLAAEAESALLGATEGALARLQTYLIMSHDGSDGRLYLENDRLRVDWPGVGDREFAVRGGDRLQTASAALGGIYLKNPIWSAMLGHSLVTVHPLGGCAMGENATSGVVNHAGQVFSGASGDAVHDGLFVSDGAIVPRSVGVNPLLTITALAERNCALLANARGWKIDYALPSAPRQHAAPPTVGLLFTERMTGPFSTTVTTDYAAAAAQGEADGSTLSFVFTIEAEDAEAMLKDPAHPSRLYGTVMAPALSPRPLAAQNGTFNLFVEDTDAASTRLMKYNVVLQSEEGKRYYFEGHKTIPDGSLLQMWPATSTLYTTVHADGDPNGAIVGRGILRIKIADFAKQMTTLATPNAPNAVRGLQALNGFGRLFAGSLWEQYGGIFAPDPVPGTRAVVREKRPLRAPAPEMHFFPALDGTELRLVRFNGGKKGPFICAPGFSNTSLCFAFDGVETTWTEYFVAQGYDVWLFDYRASGDLPACRTQFTLDDVANCDWPAAVAYVRKTTGASDVQALGHCLGSATGFMSFLAGKLTGVRQFVGSQVMPFIEVSAMSRAKAALHVDLLLKWLGVKTVTMQAGTDFGGKAIDELLRLDPMPDDWRGLGPVLRRIYAIYGAVINPQQLNQDTVDAMSWIFGYGNITAFAQIRQFIHHQQIVSAAGDDIYMPNVERIDTQVVLMQGSVNKLFLPLGSEKTYNWLREAHGDRCTRLVFDDYAHLDCFMGKNAAHDVFPRVLAELEKFN